MLQLGVPVAEGPWEGGIIASHWVNMTCFFGKSRLLAKEAACSTCTCTSEAILISRCVSPQKMWYLLGVYALNLPSKDSKRAGSTLQ